jgi:ribosomal protein S18 acetylase RimI-like enzyme
MDIEVINQPDSELLDFLDKKIAEFNWARWEVKERLPIATQIKDEKGDVVAAAAGRTFGNWLQINTLWVSDTQRGKGLGSQVLTAGQQRGCKSVLLDTLNFQAKPFYEKHGYQVEWTQPNYPKTGCKYFMSKKLV